MAQIIEIENGIARYKNVTVEYEVPLSLLEKHLTRPIPFNSPLLPKGTVQIGYDQTTRQIGVLVERAPRSETITLDPIDPEGIKSGLEDLGLEPDDCPTTIRIALPWEYYLFTGVPANWSTTNQYDTSQVTLARTELYWSPERLTSFPTMVYLPQLPNIVDGSICWGSTYHGHNTSFAQKIDTMVNNFYQTPFNEDYGHIRMPASKWDLEDIAAATIEGISPPYSWEDFESYNLTEDWFVTEPTPKIQLNTRPPDAWSMDGVKTWIEALSPARLTWLITQATDIANAEQEPVA